MKHPQDTPKAKEQHNEHCPTYMKSKVNSSPRGQHVTRRHLLERICRIVESRLRREPCHHVVGCFPEGTRSLHAILVVRHEARTKQRGTELRDNVEVGKRQEGEVETRIEAVPKCGHDKRGNLSGHFGVL